MGNPVNPPGPINQLITKLTTYENLISGIENMDNSDKIFKIREISRRIDDLSEELDNILNCDRVNDFTLTDRERAFYIQRFLLFNIFTTLI